MVNNSTNINKLSNHLSSQLTEPQKGVTLHMMLEIQVLSWDRHKKATGLNGYSQCISVLF
jgi:hypothetical protein